MVYGTETQPLKKEVIRRLNMIEIQMIRWMCRVSLTERKPSEQLRNGHDFPNIQTTCRNIEWGVLGM